MHPATRLFLWVALAAALPALSPAALHASAAAVAVSLLHPAARTPRAMIWRTRYLFLALVVLLPWSTPGRYAAMMLGALSPTIEGLRLAASQFSASFLIVAALGWAMSGLDRERRLIAFLFFLLPLAHAGLPVERLAARLGLTLAQLETGGAASGADWKTAWRRALSERYPPQTLCLDLGRWSTRDWLCIAVAVMGVVCALGFNAGI